MAQSERSKYAQVRTAWVTYQQRHLDKSEEEAVRSEPPQQFQDIFWMGHAYGVLVARRKDK